MRTDRQTDIQTDMTKLTVAFQNFAKAPKKLKRKFEGRAWVVVFRQNSKARQTVLRWVR